jgi:Fic-DOC domain mobile mystery protein B
MTTLANTSEGNIPLSPEELADLIPNLATKQELNEWERENILRAREWAFADRSAASDLASDGYVRKLHAKMFDQTWKWAGEYRRTEKNLGVPVHQVRERLVSLFGDALYWIQNNTYTTDEIAVRFHHRLVLIHPFPNGNGRHARLIADLIAMKLGRPAFTWGSANLVKPSEARMAYLHAIRAADNGDIQPLVRFARS